MLLPKLAGWWVRNVMAGRTVPAASAGEQPATVGGVGTAAADQPPVTAAPVWVTDALPAFSKDPRPALRARDAGQLIAQALDLPLDRVQALTLRVRAGCMVEVDVHMRTEPHQAAALAEELRRFVLVPRREAAGDQPEQGATP